jgi:hypothetical protein
MEPSTKRQRISNFDAHKGPQIETIHDSGSEIAERARNATENFTHLARQVQLEYSAQENTTARTVSMNINAPDRNAIAEPNVEQFLSLARLEIEHVIHTISMIQENYLQLIHSQTPKVHNATQQVLLLGHKQLALSRAARRLRDKASALSEQATSLHENYWDVLLGLRARWHLLAPRASRVVADHSNSTIGSLWNNSEYAPTTPISLPNKTSMSVLERFEDINICFPQRNVGSLADLALWHHRLKNEPDGSEKLSILQLHNNLLAREHERYFCNEALHQLLAEVSGDGTKATEGAINVDSSTVDGGPLIIRKQRGEPNDIVPHTFPYVMSILVRELLLMRYAHSAPILPSLVAIFHHAETLELLMANLNTLALSSSVVLHWRPSFITIAPQPQLQSVVLHSVCFVQREQSNPNDGLVVHLEGSNIYCVTTNPVHTIPLSTPLELKQFILNHFVIS